MFIQNLSVFIWMEIQVKQTTIFCFHFHQVIKSKDKYIVISVHAIQHTGKESNVQET